MVSHSLLEVCGLSPDAQQDFVGQKVAERLYHVIIALFGVRVHGFFFFVSAALLVHTPVYTEDIL
jgi:hypothetical protein